MDRRVTWRVSMHSPADVKPLPPCVLGHSVCNEEWGRGNAVSFHPGKNLHSNVFEEPRAAVERGHRGEVRHPFSYLRPIDRKEDVSELSTAAAE